MSKCYRQLIICKQAKHPSLCFNESQFNSSSSVYPMKAASYIFIKCKFLSTTQMGITRNIDIHTSFATSGRMGLRKYTLACTHLHSNPLTSIPVTSISEYTIQLTCALISLPMSRRSLTACVCPFMAASISGEIPSLLPVLQYHQTM